MLQLRQQLLPQLLSYLLYKDRNTLVLLAELSLRAAHTRAIQIAESLIRKRSRKERL